ncbi:FecR family protein [Rhodanobacter ginsengisoli]|uniref:FecR family protein n=1 Tax=Rhodanobacter ginsengisoli TaxID=418646 RepID=A0ABW0QQL5_9GAMM
MDSHDAIREEAAAWFARRRDGACSEEAAFEAWRDSSDAHARAYAETEHSWEQWARLQDSVQMRKMAAAAMAATSPSQRQATGKRLRPLLAAAGLAAIAVFGGIWLLPLMMQTAPVAYSTGLGEQRTEQLPDGTRIVLNTQTALQVRYSRLRRDVTLQHGEAMFEVVHDAERPFIVTAADGSVTDLGTQFLVRDENGIATVTLLQGRVDVAALNEHKQLVPGEQARYGARVAGIRVRQVDPAGITSWMRGRLDFSGLPLAQAVAEANRYSAVKLRLGDPRLADLPVGGSFRTGDNASIAAALSAVFPVRVARSDTHEIVLMPR